MSKLTQRLASITTAERDEAECRVRENYPLAIWAIGKWGWKCPQIGREELEAALLEALWVAAILWEPTTAKFSTYATLRMQWAIYALAEQSNNQSGMRHAPEGYELVRLDEPIGDGLTLGQIIPDPIDQFDLVEDAADHEAFSLPLTDRERAMINQRIDGWTLEEIGKEHHVTRERVRQIIKAIGERVMPSALAA